MPKFTLHDVDQDIWNRAEARAAAEGWKMGDLLKRLMADYADGKIAPSGTHAAKQGDHS